MILAVVVLVVVNDPSSNPAQVYSDFLLNLTRFQKKGNRVGPFITLFLRFWSENFVNFL